MLAHAGYHYSGAHHQLDTGAPTAPKSRHTCRTCGEQLRRYCCKADTPLSSIQPDVANATGTNDAQTEQVATLALALAWADSKAVVTIHKAALICPPQAASVQPQLPEVGAHMVALMKAHNILGSMTPPLDSQP